MSYRIEVRPSPAKFLRHLRDKELRGRLIEAMHALGENPRPPGSLKMQGKEALYRIRVGDYRIIYQIQDAALVILIVEIGHRREIYR